MKILYLNPIATLGGAEKLLLDIFEPLLMAQPNWQLGLIVGGRGPLVEKARSLGVTVRILPLPPAVARLGDAGGVKAGTVAQTVRLIARYVGAAVRLIPYLMQLRQAIRDFNPDIIHTNGFKMHVLGLLGRSSGTAVVWHIHDYVSRRPMMRRLLRWCGGYCAAAVAISQSVRKDVEAVCGNGLKVYCIYNGVDLKRYSPHGETADLDALSGLPASEPQTLRIGLIATLAAWKGHAVFLKAVARLPRELAWRAYVIGGPIYETNDSQCTLDELRITASKLAISDRVGFTNFIEDPSAAIRALDVVIHASTAPEPFGLVIAEAMACGRPVVSSASGGSLELLTEGGDALTHPPGDDAALADRIIQLLRNPELRSKMGRAGRSKAERCFGRNRLAAELIPVYRDVSGSQFVVLAGATPT